MLTSFLAVPYCINSHNLRFRDSDSLIGPQVYLGPIKNAAFDDDDDDNDEYNVTVDDDGGD